MKATKKMTKKEQLKAVKEENARQWAELSKSDRASMLEPEEMDEDGNKI